MSMYVHDLGKIKPSTAHLYLLIFNGGKLTNYSPLRTAWVILCIDMPILSLKSTFVMNEKLQVCHGLGLLND